MNRRHLLVFAIVLYFTFIGGSFYSEFQLLPRVFNQLVVTLILGIWLADRLRRGDGLPRTPLDRPIAVWLAVLVLTAVLGMSPRFSLEALWTPFSGVLAFYLFVDMVRRGRTALFAQALYMSATVVCLVAVGEMACWYFGLPLLPHFVQGWPAIGGWQQPVPPTLPYGDRLLSITLNGATPLSAYLALLIPPAIAILVTSRNRDNRLGLAIWLALAALIEALSYSRGGVLALLISLPLTGLSWWSARRGTARPTVMQWWMSLRSSGRPRQIRAGLLLGSLLALGVIVCVVLGSPWIDRTFAHRAPSTSFRFTLWRSALTAFSEHPLVGVGPYNYGRALLRRNDPDLPRRQVTTAHNLYLNTAAETGLLGLAAGTWMMLAGGRAFWRRWRSTTAPDERIRLGAAGAALVGLAAHSMVDTFTAMPNVLPALALAAYALTDPAAGPVPRVSPEDPPDSSSPVAARNSIPPPQEKVSRRLVVGVALAAVLLYALGLLWLDVARYYFQRSVTLAHNGDWKNATLAAQRARQLDPALTLYTFQLAHVLGAASAPSDDGHTVAPPAAATQAVDLYYDALAAEPVHGLHTANLAAVLWRLGDRETATEMMVRAVTVEPTPVLLVNTAYFFQQMGDLARAEDFYAWSLAAGPQLAVSEFWKVDGWRVEHWPDFVDRAAQRLPDGEARHRWSLIVALARHDWAEVEKQAAAVVEEAPFDCTALTARARTRLLAGQLDAARQEAQHAISVDPACGGAYVVSGQVRYAGGDAVAAERDWRTALFLGQPGAAFHLGRLFEARGDIGTAEQYYRRDLPLTAIPTDVTVTLFGWPVAFDPLPPLFRIGVGPEEAAPGLALAALYEAHGNRTAACIVYQALLAEDPYLREARTRLEAIERAQ